MDPKNPAWTLVKESVIDGLRKLSQPPVDPYEGEIMVRESPEPSRRGSPPPESPPPSPLPPSSPGVPPWLYQTFLEHNRRRQQEFEEWLQRPRPQLPASLFPVPPLPESERRRQRIARLEPPEWLDAFAAGEVDVTDPKNVAKLNALRTDPEYRRIFAERYKDYFADVSPEHSALREVIPGFAEKELTAFINTRIGNALESLASKNPNVVRIPHLRFSYERFGDRFKQLLEENPPLPSPLSPPDTPTEIGGVPTEEEAFLSFAQEQGWTGRPQPSGQEAPQAVAAVSPAGAPTAQPSEAPSAAPESVPSPAEPAGEEPVTVLPPLDMRLSSEPVPPPPAESASARVSPPEVSPASAPAPPPAEVAPGPAPDVWQQLTARLTSAPPLVPSGPAPEAAPAQVAAGPTASPFVSVVPPDVFGGPPGVGNEVQLSRILREAVARRTPAPPPTPTLAAPSAASMGIRVGPGSPALAARPESLKTSTLRKFAQGFLAPFMEALGFEFPIEKTGAQYALWAFQQNLKDLEQWDDFDNSPAQEYALRAFAQTTGDSQTKLAAANLQQVEFIGRVLAHNQVRHMIAGMRIFGEGG